MASPIMQLPPENAPFLLFDDARPGGGGRLYAAPEAIVLAHGAAEVPRALERVREALAAGRHVAGYLRYEAGLALEPRLSGMARRDEAPLLWFGLFDPPHMADAAELDRLFASLPPGRAGSPQPLWTQQAYRAAFDRVQDYIRAGDVYQVNLTFPSSVAVEGDPAGAYAGLRSRAGAGHGCLARCGNEWILSLSPELFFRLDNGVLTTRPMKGTATRGADARTDAQAALALRSDAKQQAENLMIVDLLRNDLSRVAVPGSVQVPALFEVETYPTVHQMTSTVTARLAPNRDVCDVLSAIFPCGSITGAPKIRAMEIIAEVEGRARGVYTGSLGWIEPSGNAEFNVAIRTISIENGANRGVIGLGSGVVADSQADAEWIECLDKARFLNGDDE